MYTKLRKVNEGFTIVETLIVLAIAALIITIILIAVPDLQRSGRNSNILHDAQNVATAVQRYESNNQGSIPGVPTSAIQQGPQVTVGASGTATDTATIQGATFVNQVNVVPASIVWTASPPTSGVKIGVGYIVVVLGADCNGTNGPGPATGATLTPNTDARAVAIYYPIETSGGGNVGCVQQ